MIYTLFVNPELTASPYGATPLDLDDLVEQFPPAGLIRHNVLYYTVQRVMLDNGFSSAIRLIEDSARWQMIICRVVGAAAMSFTSLDWDGITTLTTVVPTQGTKLFPGFAIATPGNISAAFPTIISSQDDTVVDIYTFGLAADNDSALVDNA